MKPVAKKRARTHLIDEDIIKSVKKPCTLTDGGGLSMQVRAGRDGLRHIWLFRRMVDGTSHQSSLGLWPAVSLDTARTKAGAMRANLAHFGTLIDPATKTFGAWAEEWLTSNSMPPDSDLGRRWRRNLKNHASMLTDRPIGDITVRDIHALLSPMWVETPRAAKILQRQLSRIFAGAVALGYCATNPAAWQGNLEFALGKIKKPTKHHPALPSEFLPSLWQRLLRIERPDAEGVAALAVQFAILTAARTSEVRHMAWDDLDLDAKIWIVPAHKIKMGKEHVVALSDAAIEVLRLARLLPRIGKLVFPSKRSIDGTVSRKTMSRYFKRRLPDGQSEATLHGTARSTFGTWAREQGYRDDTIEHSLAHQVGTDVSRAYIRTTVFEERRQLMSDWAEFVTSGLTEPQNVSALNSAARPHDRERPTIPKPL